MSTRRAPRRVPGRARRLAAVGLAAVCAVTAVGGAAAAARAATDERPVAPAGASPAAAPRPGAPEVAPDQVLVRPASGHGAGSLRTELGASATAATPGSSWLRVPLEDETPEQAMARLRRDPRVAQVEPVLVRRAAATPNDPGYAASQRAYLATVRAPEAWEVTQGTGSMVVAVVDSGVRTTHEDLRGKLVPGYDAVSPGRVPTDRLGHGTTVAGVVASATGNGLGAAGVGWHTRVMPVNVFRPVTTAGGTDWVAYDPDIAAGVRWAVAHGARVVNLSLGGYGSSPVLAEAIAYAQSRDVVVVAAAGNEGTPERFVPASLPGVVSVGATDAAGRLAPWSNWGEHQALTAPGAPVWGPQHGSDRAYGTAHGTSFAAPVVAGVAALVRTRFPTASAATVRARLLATARDAGPRGTDPYYGAGVVDAAAAVGAPFGSPLPVAVEPGTEPGPLPALGRPAAASQSGGIVPEGDEDWWTIEVGADRVLQATVTPTGTRSPLDPVLTVYDPADRRLVRVDAGYAGEPETVALRVPSPGRYAVVVGGYTGATGSYTLHRSSAAALSSPTGADPVWVRGASPAPAARGVPTAAPLVLDLARPVVPSSVTSASVALLDGRTGAPVTTRVGFDEARARVTVTPAQPLRPGAAYVVVVRGLRDGTTLTTSPTLRWSFETALPGGLRFTPTAPVRVLDTRSGLGARAGALPDAGVVDLQVTGRAGVPATARSVVLNVTALGAARSATVAVYPTPADGVAVPAVSSQNLAAGEVAANLVTVPVGAGGRVRLRVTGAPTHLAADLAGYHAATGPTGYTPLAPARLLDTRSGLGAPRARVGAGRVLDVVVAGRGGVPSHAAAVALNLTAVTPTAATYLRAFPTPLRGSALPTASNLNVAAGDTRANLVVVPVGRDGRVRLHNAAGAVHLLADVAGFFAPDGATGFAPAAPVRVLDTRTGAGAPGPLAAGRSVDVPLAAPVGARAAVLNVTAVRPVAAGHLTVWPTPAVAASAPTASTLNVPAGRVRPNAAVVALGVGSRVRVTTTTTSHVVADLAGWYVP